LGYHGGMSSITYKWFGEYVAVYRCFIFICEYSRKLCKSF
jgi:hypothetical protein